ncbi:MAG TPA: hypothetical protein ENI62_08590 [Gammaproteobacteria bacterium]|mgnify:CR=1 FL=1|nr:hypothetical protein [Gammaproteobacteria bacterium]
MKTGFGSGGQITVAYVLNGRQVVELFTIAADETIGHFLQRRQCQSRVPEVVRNRDYGVFSQLAGPETCLNDGDRLEFYQPLCTNPLQKRHQLASRRLSENRSCSKGK